MPPKRTWSQANENGQTSLSPVSRPRLSDAGAAPPTSTPTISRKVTACASCRKQKIKCIMEDGPPCKRCTERNLSCVLNKSLQSLIEERSHWTEVVFDDIVRMHSSLQQALTKLDLPKLPPLSATKPRETTDLTQNDIDEDEELRISDDSPRMSPKEEGLPLAPIDSLYQITRLKTLRSDESPNEHKTPVDRSLIYQANDFISKGLIDIEDAERLVGRFVNRIDHFMYLIGSGPYRSLDSLRRNSPILTACICAVAALHDPGSNHLYRVCAREFRRLMSAAMFNRRMDQDCMRAMCIASYWLHDLSWMISGYAIRRAMEINLSSSYEQALTHNDEEAMNNVRIWYILYICDRHLSILYGRPSIVRDDDRSVAGWEKILRSPMCTESDKRLISQLALLQIMGSARELFGPDTGEPIPVAFASRFENFSSQIDKWVGYWSTVLLKLHESIGEFPTKGALLHHHLAKLHLHSHVFRGLRGAPVPIHFHESAMAAVGAARSIIEMVLTDPNIRDGLAGIPHYIHSMIAFACVFLLKTATQYAGKYIEDSVVVDLTTKAVQQFRATPVGKYHLVHLMAEGLEKMLKKRKTHENSVGTMLHVNTMGFDPAAMNGPESALTMPGSADSTGFVDENGNNVINFDDTFDFGTSSFLNFDNGTINLDFTGFDFQ